MFSKMSLKFKLLLLCCFMGAVSVIISLVGYFGIHGLSDNLKNVASDLQVMALVIG